MRIKTLIAATLAAAALTVGLAACSTSTDTAAPASSTATSAPATSSAAPVAELSGTFAGLNDKKVSGTVTVSGDTVVLSGFSSDEGPDLHVYLTNGTDEAAVSAGVQVSAVAFNKASQTFTLKGVDAASFNTVVIHCDKAKAVFGAAPLS